ncbi:MAG: glycosyltransferase family 39 protein [Anaerolineae bacterium]|nr:glycosyltransferase family 39 protein [Anaerolineae bacterium]
MSLLKKPQRTMRALLLLATAVRFFGLGVRSFWFDEAFTVVVTRIPLRDSLEAILTLGAYSPFYYLLLRPTTALLGQSEYAYRFLSALFGILTVPLIYRVGSRWFDRRAGLLAALLLAICPFHLLYSQDGRMYTIMAFFSLAAMSQFEQVQRGKRWLPFILYSAVAYLCHYAAIFMIYVQLVLLLPRLRRGRLFRHWFAAQALALLPLAPWLIAYVVENWQQRALGIGWIPRPTLLSPLLTLWNMGSADTDTATAGVLALAALYGAVLASGLLARAESVRTLRWWLLLPILTNLIVSLRQPLYVDRYFMGSLPACILLLVAGILRWQPRWLRWAAAAAVVAVMGWGTARIVSGDPYFAKEDWRQAAAAIDAALEPGDRVVLQDQETLIGVSAYRQQEWPVEVLVPGEEQAALDAALAAHRRVWMVLRSFQESNHRLCKSAPFDPFSEAAAPIQAWLAAHRAETAVVLPLPGVAVVRMEQRVP